MIQNNILQELLEIARNCPQESYNQIISQRKDWDTLYHFSHLRENALEWLPIEKSKSVLEIGSGCGALTGLLCKKAGKVVGIEKSEAKNKINAARCKTYLKDRKDQTDNHENDAYKSSVIASPSLRVGTLEELLPSMIENQEKYDWLVAVDQFMDSVCETWKDDSLAHFIKVASQLLTSEGRILLALPNRLGMKYFSGCAESKTGKFFEGVEGYLTEKGAYAYSKQELIDQIKKAGDYEYDFYYPYPDHLFAMSIYSDEYLPKLGELRTNHNNFDRIRLELFDETEAFDGIIKSGLFPQFSNSYLVILTRRKMYE